MLKSLFALMILILAIFLFSQLFYIPYVASPAWLILNWAGINTVFAGFFYYLSLKRVSSKKEPIYKKGWRIINALLNATMVTFFILVLAADATMFFARQPFREEAIIRKIECHESLFFTEYTTIHFSDNKKDLSLIFRNNVCKEYPGGEDDLKNKRVTLYGREWFLGKYYDQLNMN